MCHGRLISRYVSKCVCVWCVCMFLNIYLLMLFYCCCCCCFVIIIIIIIVILVVSSSLIAYPQTENLFAAAVDRRSVPFFYIFVIITIILIIRIYAAYTTHIHGVLYKCYTIYSILHICTLLNVPLLYKCNASLSMTNLYAHYAWSIKGPPRIFRPKPLKYTAAAATTTWESTSMAWPTHTVAIYGRRV